MAPKSKSSAAAADGESGNEAQRAKDAMVIFNSLFHLVNPLVINVKEIAEQTGEKVNTLHKRFSVLRQRYPDIKITSSSSGSSAAAASASASTPAPATPKAKKSSATARATPKKQRTTKNTTEDNDSEDENEVFQTKPFNGAEDDAGDDDDDVDNDDNDNDGTATAPKASARTKTPATPGGASTSDHNLADDEKSVRKPRAKASTAKASTAKASKAKANTKRKRDDDSEDPAPEPKKARKPGRPKKVSKPKVQAKKSDVRVEDAETEDEDGEDGKQALTTGGTDHMPLMIERDDLEKATSTSTPSDSEQDLSERDNKIIREEDLALDVVKSWATRSRQAPLSQSPMKPSSQPVHNTKSPVIEDGSEATFDQDDTAEEHAQEARANEVPAEDEGVIIKTEELEAEGV